MHVHDLVPDECVPNPTFGLEHPLESTSMEITWYGQSCFRLTERSMLTVVTDPYATKKDSLKLKADAVTISKDVPSHNHVDAVAGSQRGDVRVIRGPGEYEMGGVFITGVPMKPGKKEGEKCTVYAYNYEGVNIAHLGGLTFVPTQAQIDALETVDVLLIPVNSEGNGLSAQQASEVISMIEPSLVVPMAYEGGASGEGLMKFLKELGLTNPKTQDALKVTKGGLPEDTQVILLEAKE